MRPSPLTFTAILTALMFLLPLAPMEWDAEASPDPVDEDTAFGGSGITYFGDWYVDELDDLYYGNQTIVLDGNLTINGTGRLVLSNVDLVFNCNATLTYWMDVKGALEVRDGSNLTVSNTSCNFWAQARAGADLTLRDSTISECGLDTTYFGFRVSSDKAIIENCLFLNGTGGLDIRGHNITVENCTFANAHTAVRANDVWNLTARGCRIVTPIYGFDLVKTNGIIDNCTFESVYEKGVRASSLFGLTVNNCTFHNGSENPNGATAVELLGCRWTAVTGNQLMNSTMGIDMSNCKFIGIGNNTIGSHTGIQFGRTMDCYLAENDIYSGLIPIKFKQYNKKKHLLHDIDYTNTYFGAPIRYVKETDSYIPPTGDGMTILVDCHNATIKDEAFSFHYNGLYLLHCSHATVKDVSFQADSHIRVDRCWDSNISGASTGSQNIFIVARSKGIELYDCDLAYADLLSEDGLVQRCDDVDLRVRGNRTAVRDCSFQGFRPVSLYSRHNEVLNCTFRDSSTMGSGLNIMGRFNDITFCTFTNMTDEAVWFSPAAAYNTIVDCTFNENAVDVTIDGDYNIVYHNNFYNVTDGVEGVMGTNRIFDNVDDRSEGNYWDDYRGLDNGQGGRTTGDGVGDTDLPHHRDNYPMMKPWGWKLPKKPDLGEICPQHGGLNNTGAYNVTWVGNETSQFYRLQESMVENFQLIEDTVETTEGGAGFTGRTNATYYYRVRGVNKWGVGPWSDTEGVVVDHLPFMPQGLTVEPLPDGNALDISWQKSAGADVAGYQVHTWLGSESKWVLLADMDHPANSTVHHALADGRNYSYRVRSTDERGQHSEWSPTVVGVPTDTQPPNMPVGLTVGEVSSDSIKIYWQTNIEIDVQGYMIYRSTGGADVMTVDPLNPGEPWPDPVYVDKDVEPGTSYHYTVSAVDEVPNESPRAFAVTATTGEANHPPEIAHIQYDVEIPEDHIDEDSINLKRWFRDPDGDNLDFRFKGAKNITVTVFKSSGEVTLEPKPDWNGEEEITFTAFDGYYRLNDTVKVTVTFVNDPPEDAFILTPADGTTVKEGTAVNFTGTAQDIDEQYGDVLVFSWFSNISGPLGLGRNLSVTNLDPGYHTITLHVKDLAGRSANDTMLLTVLKKVIPVDGKEEPPNGTEDGQDGVEPPPVDDGEDGTGGDGGDGREGLLSGPAGIALAAAVAAVIAVVLAIIMLVVVRRRRAREARLKEEEDGEEKLEGEAAFTPRPVPRPGAGGGPKPMLPGGSDGKKLIPEKISDGDGKVEMVEGEWEIPVEGEEKKEPGKADLTKDIFSKKKASVVEAEVDEF